MSFISNVDAIIKYHETAYDAFLKKVSDGKNMRYGGNTEFSFGLTVVERKTYNNERIFSEDYEKIEWALEVNVYNVLPDEYEMIKEKLQSKFKPINVERKENKYGDSKLISIWTTITIKYLENDYKYLD